MQENVVLVNENDEILGEMEKLRAHQTATLHRAFSVFIFNDDNKLMLQQRAKTKYHSPLLWTNTCCSHPKINETYIEAAHRRLQEELGFDCELQEKFWFIYKADVGENLWEHELDYVFTGKYQGEIDFNKDEVQAIEWKSLEEIVSEMKNSPEKFTVWFKIIFEKYLQKL